MYYVDEKIDIRNSDEMFATLVWVNQIGNAHIDVDE